MDADLILHQLKLIRRLNLSDYALVRIKDGKKTSDIIPTDAVEEEIVALIDYVESHTKMVLTQKIDPQTGVRLVQTSNSRRPMEAGQV